MKPVHRLLGSVRLLLVLGLFVLGDAHAAWHQRSETIMGTRIEVEVWHENIQTARAAMAAVMAEMQRVDALMSTYREDSELSRLNREGAAGPVAVSAELLELLLRARQLSELTEGAFDVTYASVGYLYDYHALKKPDGAALTASLPQVDYRHVIVDRTAGTVAYRQSGVRVDLGGIAKGYAVERAASILRAHGVEHAQVGAGGDTRLLGDRRGRPWIVGVRDPREREQVVVRLPLADRAISTSGDYERYFEHQGTRYHHIIDPGTGASPGAVRSVTVIGAEGTSTDALSTGLFVLGRERALALVNELPEVEAIIVDDRQQLWFSRGLQERAPKPAR